MDLHPAENCFTKDSLFGIPKYPVPDEIKVKAGTPFVLVITNKDTAAEEFESQELRIEKIIPAGKTVRGRMPALKAGTYTFIGEYHAKTAPGHIVAA